MTEGDATFGKVDGSLTDGPVIDLGVVIEYKAVEYRDTDAGDAPKGSGVAVYMPDDSTGLVDINSWRDEDHEGGREAVLELARAWVRKTYSETQCRRVIQVELDKTPNWYFNSFAYQSNPKKKIDPADQ